MKTKLIKFKQKRSLCVTSSARVGTDDVGTLRLTEGPKAAVSVLGSDRKMIGGAGLELSQSTGHGQRKGLDLANLFPVLLCCAVGIRVVLVEGI